MDAYIMNLTDLPNRNRSVPDRPARLVLAVLALITSLLTSCAAPPASPPETDVGPTSRVLENIDLTDAHRDKRKFLAAIPLLGRSLDSDLATLEKMTQRRFKPRPQSRLTPEGEIRHHAAEAGFSPPALVTNGVFEYRTRGNTYRSSVAFSFNRDVVCIRLDDLEAALGRPTRVITEPDSPHARGTGPSDVWYVVYRFLSGGRLVFTFSTAVCANSVTFASDSLAKD